MKQEPYAWTNGKGKFVPPSVKDFDARTGGIRGYDCDIPLYTAPRELSDAIELLEKEANKPWADVEIPTLWDAIEILKKASER